MYSFKLKMHQHRLRPAHRWGVYRPQTPIGGERSSIPTLVPHSSAEGPVSLAGPRAPVKTALKDEKLLKKSKPAG